MDSCKPCTNAAQRARYHADPDRHRARNRAHYWANRERCLAASRAYRQENQDRERARNRERYRANREDRRITRICSTYAISPERYRAMLEAQDGRCAICGTEDGAKDDRSGRPIRLSVDHDHACCAGERSCGRCVRGLLCPTCNTGLGMLQDEPDRLEKAADYVRRAS